MSKPNKELRGKEWAQARLSYLIKTKGVAGKLLPNSCHLYWDDNGIGGRKYLSDEIGGGVEVWDTCLVQDSTLLAALTQEAELYCLEQFLKRP